MLLSNMELLLDGAGVGVLSGEIRDHDGDGGSIGRVGVNGWSFIMDGALEKDRLQLLLKQVVFIVF